MMYGVRQYGRGRQLSDAVRQKALKGLMALLLTQCRLYCTFRDIIYHTCGLFIKSSKKIVWFKTSLMYVCAESICQERVQIL